MFCPKCGKTIEEGVIFCPNCGAKVSEALQVVPPATNPTRGIETKKGFFASLFDFSFTEFITTKMIKLLYVLGHIFSGLVALALIIFGFRKSTEAGFRRSDFISLSVFPTCYYRSPFLGERDYYISYRKNNETIFK